MDTIDAGFDAVFACEVYKPDEEQPADPQPTPSDGAIYAAVSRANTPPEEQDEIDRAVTAAVTTVLTEEGKEAEKALIALPPLDWPVLSQLAREIAMNLKERHVVLKEYNLTKPQYEYLEANNEFYQNALAAACKDWHAPLSIQERLKVEAATILEDGLPGLGARMQSKSEGLPGVIEAAKLFAKIAGVGEREAGASAPGERFTINIDLGGGQNITVQSSPVQEATSEPIGVSPVPALPKT